MGGSDFSAIIDGMEEDPAIKEMREKAMRKKAKLEPKYVTEARDGMKVLPKSIVDNQSAAGFWSVAWNHVDNTIVTGSQDGLVKTWQCVASDEGDKLTHTQDLGQQLMGVTSVATAGDKIAAASMDRVVKVWDIKGTELQTVNTECTGVALSPDGQHVATGTQAGEVAIFSVASGEQEAVLETGGKGVMSVAYSADGSTLACGSMDGLVHTFDVATAKSKGKMEGHSMPVRTVSFVQDSLRVISGSDDRQINTYDTQNASKVDSMHSGHDWWVLSVAHNPVRDQFMSSSSDKTVKAWDNRKKGCVMTFREMHKDQVWQVAYGQDGNRLVSVSDDKSLVLYDVSGE